MAGAQLYTSWPQVAFNFCQKRIFMKITRGCSLSSHWIMARDNWPSWGRPFGHYHWFSLFITANLLLKFGRIQFGRKKKNKYVLNSDKVKADPCCRCPLLFEPRLPAGARDVNNETKTTGNSRWFSSLWQIQGLRSPALHRSAKNVQTNDQDDPCHIIMSSMTRVPINVRKKTCPRGTTLCGDFKFRSTGLMLVCV